MVFVEGGFVDQAYFGSVLAHGHVIESPLFSSHVYGLVIDQGTRGGEGFSILAVIGMRLFWQQIPLTPYYDYPYSFISCWQS